MHTKLMSVLMPLICLISTGSASADLIAHWPFDDGDGATATDDIGGGGNVALTGGPSWDTGMTGGALNFSGSTQYGLVANNAVVQLRSSTNYTVAVWVKVQNTSAGLILFRVWAAPPGRAGSRRGGGEDAPRQEATRVRRRSAVANAILGGASGG
jgi:hypothetical protein